MCKQLLEQHRPTRYQKSKMKNLHCPYQIDLRFFHNIVCSSYPFKLADNILSDHEQKT